jgi:Fur family ferric uptake transcriptional regulator
LLQADLAMTAAEVVTMVQASLPGASAATVYRTLEQLQLAGIVVHVHLRSGLGYRPAARPQVAYLTCGACGAESVLGEGALRPLERLVEGACGFRPDFAHHAISGLCAGCASADPARR